jgi:hypothetical protein
MVTGRPLCAQQRSALDVGLSYVRFPDDSTSVAGPSIGWTSAAERRLLFGQLNAGAVGTLGAASGSATLTGGVRAPVTRRWLLEGAGELFGVAGSSSHSAATATAAGRLIRLVGSGGAWARAAASAARREAGSLPGQALEAGAWWGWPRGRVTATLLQQRAKGQLFAGPFRDLLVGTVPVRYTEGSLGAHLEGDAVSFDFSAGMRHDLDAAQMYEPTFAITAAFWQAPTRAWTVSVSRQPPDFVRGADATRWVALGMRFYEPSPAMARSARVRPVVMLSGTGEQRVVRVRAVGAHLVELMADFTDWAPVALSPSGDGFERELAVSPGTHRVLVRIDGGRWRPAANTPAVDDDLGGRVGLLVVP